MHPLQLVRLVEGDDGSFHDSWFSWEMRSPKVMPAQVDGSLVTVMLERPHTAMHLARWPLTTKVDTM
jgi:hypothetical protein